MKRICIALSACLFALCSFATIATPEPLEVTQADGTKLTIKLVGDEFHHYHTLLDGTPIRLNNQGMWVKDESLLAEPQMARKARLAQQLDSSYPLTGSPKSLVILVNFQDLKFQYSLDDFQRLLTESGYSDNEGVGSCRDYFIACSDSLFSPDFMCFGPVTVSQNYAYYGGNENGRTDTHIREMVVEACQLVAAEGVDMTQFDTNKDDRLDNVFIYYAGHNEAEHGGANTIWPHRSIVISGERVDGKLIYDYSCTSELRGARGNSMCGIGTFCHEFGHVLGLPDYYDTGNSSRYTVGSWDIMSSGNYNGSGKTPPAYNAGERFQLGWLKPVQLTEAGPYELEPLETSNKAYLIAATTHNMSWEKANPNEYWLLENRQHLGWDTPATSMEGTGMLIWHVDYNKSIWEMNQPNNSTPLRFDIEEAGGSKYDSSDSDPFPGSANVVQFTPRLHNGDFLAQPILDIAQIDNNISFIFKSKGEDNLIFLPAELPLLESSYNPDTKKASTPAYSLKLLGNHLAPGDLTLKMTGTGFYFSVDNKNWKTSMTLSVGADSTVTQELFIHYAPKKVICEEQRGSLVARHAGAVSTFNVRGISPRPTLISVPKVTAVNEVSPTSFKVHWKPQDDAEEYYVTLYHMEDGSESVMESFENFDDEAVVREAGWTSSFYRTTTKAKEEGTMSIWFKMDGENMLSPKYTLPVTEVSMWLNAPQTSDSEVGWIILYGYNENKEYVLDTIDIKRSTKKYTYSKELAVSKNITRFKIVYAALGGEGVCLDAFTTTFNRKTVYTYKGREYTVPAYPGTGAADSAVFYAYDLMPNTDYYVRLQCSENKGCQEHLTNLSEPKLIRTKEGGDIESKHLTIDYDSISYEPATHVVYIPQVLEAGSICIYGTDGELVQRIPVAKGENVVALPDEQLRRGTIYLIKFLPNDKLARKSPWVKILYK